MNQDEITLSYKRLSAHFEDWVDPFQWNKIIMKTKQTAMTHGIPWKLEDQNITFSINELNILIHISLFNINNYDYDGDNDYTTILKNIRHLQNILYEREDITEKIPYIHEGIIEDESTAPESPFIYWELENKRKKIKP